METIAFHPPTEKKGIRNISSGIKRIMGKVLERPILLLFLLWALYFLLDFCVIILLKRPVNDPVIPLYNFLAGFLVIGFFLIDTLPGMDESRNKFKAVFLLVVVLFVFFSLKFTYLKGFHKLKPDSFEFLLLESLRIFQFLVFTAAFWISRKNFLLQQQKLRDEIQKKEILLDKEKIQIEKDRLWIEHRSIQISPHFVFNTLSFVSIKIAECSKESVEEFENLSSLIRYSFKSLEAPNFINEEIEAFQSYLICLEARFGTLSVIFEIEDFYSLSEYLFLPKLTILTLVENAFLHGDFRNPNLPILIRFFIRPSDNPNTFIFTALICNPILKGPSEIGSGFGSGTVLRILQHYFGDDFNYFISSDGQEYSILITIFYDTENQIMPNRR